MLPGSGEFKDGTCLSMDGQVVTCGACGHPATVSAASDAWKCNCYAGIGPDPGCSCDAVNQEPGTEDNPPAHTSAETERLLRELEELDMSEPFADERKARLLGELRSAVDTEGGNRS